MSLTRNSLKAQLFNTFAASELGQYFSITALNALAILGADAVWSRLLPSLIASQEWQGEQRWVPHKTSGGLEYALWSSKDPHQHAQRNNDSDQDGA